MDVTSYLLGKRAGGGGTPTLQAKEVEITENGTTNISADTGYDGLSEVEVTTDVEPTLQNKSVTINNNTTTSISADSNYDGLDTVSVTTNVQPDLESKSVTITENTTTTITPTSGKDGLSSVSVTTNVSGGADLSEYFNTEITTNVSSGSFEIIKKIPTIHIGDNVTSIANLFDSSRGNSFIATEPIKITGGINLTSLWGAFGYAQNQLDLTELNTSSVTTLRSCFSNAFNNIYSPFRTLDLSTWDTSRITDINYMFSYCIRLSFIDMRTFEFTNITNKDSVFGSSGNSGVPNNCEIIVKDSTQKDWVTTNYSRLTNVKTVEEYEASQA